MNFNEGWSNSSAVPAVCASSIVVILASTWFLRKKSDLKKSNNAPVEVQNGKSNLKPEKWVKVGKIKKLIVYPIKSCQGLVVEKGVITTLGLKCCNANIRDRDFMVVDENGKQVTMDKFPRMALIQVTVQDGDLLTLNAPDMPPFTFTFPKQSDEIERLGRVKHDGHLKSLDCGDDVAQWFCEFLENSSLRVYYHHLNETQRTFEPYMYKCPQFEQSDMGLFHNETSYMMCAEESIAELNKRLAKESSWKNWRPSILIDEVNEPFAEVNWSFVRIGNKNGILKASVPCYRCLLTTVDNDTGVMPKDGEPLKTLRLMNLNEGIADKKVAELLKSKGIMGLRLGLYLPAGEGAIVNENDPVYAALL